MARVQIEEHNGHRIVTINCRNCTPAELIDTIEEVREVVTAQPPRSVHTLTDYTGAQFDREALERMKLVAAIDRPHIIRAAFIGVDTLPDQYHKAIQNFSARQFALFKTREEAIEYLTEDDAAKQSA